MKLKKLHKNTLIVLVIDALLVTGALYLAHLIRFDFSIPDRFFYNFLRLLPWAIAIKLGAMYVFDLYSGMWRYTSVSDLINVIKATTVSSLAIFMLILLVYRFYGFSRSVFIMDWCLMLMAISAFRLGIRIYFESTSNGPSLKYIMGTLLSQGGKSRSDRKRLLIIGAGDGGEKIYREIHDNAQLQYTVVGFLDDNPAKVGRKIHGIPVLGDIKRIEYLARSAQIDEALIAIPSANSNQMRTIVERCKRASIPFKTIPSYTELINDSVSLQTIREVAYRDLIRREQVKLDEQRIKSYIQGATILVTGAGGSIGSELCRQISRFDPERIILLERAESQLYNIEVMLKAHFDQIKIVPTLGDILDDAQLEKTFSRYHPNLIFHAAAYKHVPLLEEQPWKAVENNIIGTAKLIAYARKYHLQKFVLVSTDKAVQPTNVMGATKRVAEMLTLNQNICQPTETKFLAVRFGNVLGSAGSVVPLFKQQIMNGGPVTVTHPEVQRFFMTISEACQLILQSAAMGEGGEIFILDMGEPIKIDDMARDLIRLSGFEPGSDIEITYTGLRPGEKLREELTSREENILPTYHGKISKVKATTCDINLLNGQIEELSIYAKQYQRDRLIERLQGIVSDFKLSIRD